MSTAKLANETHTAREQLLRTLRTPETLTPVRPLSESEFVGDDGESYPRIGGVICLLKETEREQDLGDGKFYERNPFGARDWSDPQEVEDGVEDDIKNLLKKYPTDALIADVGAGTGRVSNYLSFHDFENVISLDYSLTSLKEIEKNSSNLCVWGNNLCVPLDSNSFDLVISTGVIHHTPDPRKAVAECARIVKPGGRFYLKARNIHSPYGYLFHTYGALLRFFESKSATRLLSNLLGFQVYKLTRRVFYSHLPHRDDEALRGKYENLFIKRMIQFFATETIESWLRENDLEIEYGRKVSFTHRQHFYVAKKH